MSYVKEDKFIAEHADTWRKLEVLTAKFKAGRLHKLDKQEIDEFYFLYNRACGHLSLARTSYGNSRLVTYLNGLVESGHSLIYTTKSSNFRRFLRFFSYDFPMLTWEKRNFLLVSFLVFFLSMAFSFVLTVAYPDNASAFLSKDMIENVNFNSERPAWDSQVMSSQILTNNIRVGFTAFALGITLGAGTIYVLVSNSFLLGSLAALAQNSGHGFFFWSLILPHGVPELFAIFLCGAAGLVIGYSLIHPGQLSRKDSFIKGGKTAIRLVCGTIPIFVIAGIIEGFFTPLPILPVWKYLFTVFITALIAFYFIFFTVRGKRKKLQIEL